MSGPKLDRESLLDAFRLAGRFELEGSELEIDFEGCKVRCKIERLLVVMAEESSGDASVEAARSLAPAKGEKR